MSNNVKQVNLNPLKVITGPDTRWSYANIWEAKSINGGTPKFSVSLIIPKSDTITVAKIKAAIEAAYHEGEARLKGNGKSVPTLSSIKTPLRDGDTERPDDLAYFNSYFINANSATAPGVVDVDRQPIITRSEVYSGVYGRASISFYAFNSNGNRGIACGLNNLQKVRDGEPLGGRSRAEDDFSTDQEEDLQRWTVSNFKCRKCPWAWYVHRGFDRKAGTDSEVIRMAKVEIKMPEEFLLKVSRLADQTDTIIPKVLAKGAEVVVAKVKSNLDSVIGSGTKFPSASTGELQSSLGVTSARQNREGNYNVKIGFSEPRRDGKSNAKIANIIEYGKHSQPAKPFLKPAKSATRKPCIDAMTQKLNEELMNL